MNEVLENEVSRRDVLKLGVGGLAGGFLFGDLVSGGESIPSYRPIRTKNRETIPWDESFEGPGSFGGVEVHESKGPVYTHDPVNGGCKRVDGKYKEDKYLVVEMDDWEMSDKKFWNQSSFLTHEVGKPIIIVGKDRERMVVATPYYSNITFTVHSGVGGIYNPTLFKLAHNTQMTFDKRGSEKIIRRTFRKGNKIVNEKQIRVGGCIPLIKTIGDGRFYITSQLGDVTFDGLDGSLDPEDIDQPVGGLDPSVFVAGYRLDLMGFNTFPDGLGRSYERDESFVVYHDGMVSPYLNIVPRITNPGHKALIDQEGNYIPETNRFSVKKRNGKNGKEGFFTLDHWEQSDNFPRQ